MGKTLSRLILRWKRNVLARYIFFFRSLGVRRPPRIASYGNKCALLAVPAGCASVIIPALNEERRIADVVAYALRDPATGEVIVVDDGSIDSTVEKARQAGAKVITSSMLGKGASMRDGVGLAQKDLLVYLDGDLSGLSPNIITSLCRPLLHEDADLVKASFGRSGGRVTELTARPMIKIFFPELADITQPLGGIIAAQKALLQQISFEDGYGVDVGLLLDAFRKGAEIAQVNIGSIQHESQSLCDLTAMANEISRVIFQRAKDMGRLHVEQVAAMAETQRQAAAGLSYIMSRRKGQQKLLLLDMDGTITPARFAIELAKDTGKHEALTEALHQNEMESKAMHTYEESIVRTGKIGKIFRFIHRRIFEKVARSIPIREGVIEFVKEMRRRGFMVGIVTDSYFIAAEIVRRRIFADFALAHTVTFTDNVCSGEVQINPAFISEKNGISYVSKKHVLHHFFEESPGVPFSEIWAVGDNLNDLELLESVDRGFVINPKSSKLTSNPKVKCISSFKELVQGLPEKSPESAPRESE